jgi:hypothetical protein
VYGSTHIYGNAQVYENVRVYGNAYVYDNADIYGNTHVYGNAHVYGDAQVHGDVWLYGAVRVFGGLIKQGTHDWCIVWADCDYYSKCLVDINGVAWVGAGCRWFTLGDAIKHWTDHREDRSQTVALLQGDIAMAKLKNLKHN